MARHGRLLAMLWVSLLCQNSFSLAMPSGTLRPQFAALEMIPVTTTGTLGHGVPPYDLPLCQPDSISPDPPMSVGELVSYQRHPSSRRYQTNYDIKMLKNETCKLLCVIPRIFKQGGAARNLQSLLLLDHKERSVRLSIAGASGPGSEYVLGYHDADDFYITNHLAFKLEYDTTAEPNGHFLHSVVSASVEATSGATTPNSISGCEANALPQRYAGEVVFTYSVYWVKHEKYLADKVKPADSASNWLLNFPWMAVVLSLLPLFLIVRVLGKLDLRRKKPDTTTSEFLMIREFHSRHETARNSVLPALIGCGAHLALLTAFCPSPGDTLWRINPAWLTALASFTAGAVAALMCPKFSDSFSAFTTAIISLLPNVVHYGLPAAEAAILPALHSTFAPPMYLILSAFARNVAISACACYLGFCLVKPHVHWRLSDSMLCADPWAFVSAPRDVAQHMRLMGATWLCICTSLEVAALVWWPWRSSFVHVYTLVGIFHILGVTWWSIVSIFRNPGQGGWEIYCVPASSGGLFLLAAFVIFGSSAWTYGTTTLSVFLTNMSMLALVLGLSSGSVGVLAARCSKDVWDHMKTTTQ